MIAAILKAQWLSMRLRVGTRRASALFSAITGLIFYGFWAFFASGSMLFFSSPENAGIFVPALASGLLFVMLYWQLAPVISASFGASLDLSKLRVYPVPHGKLFTVEVLLRLTTCAEMLILVSGAVIGLIRNPLFGLRAFPFIAGGALLFCATNILLSAGNRNFLERLFLRTRMKEVVVVMLILVGLLPQILITLNVKEAMLERFVPSQAFWPWGSAARFMLRDSKWVSGVFSLFYASAAYLYGRWQFERSLRFDGEATPRSERVLAAGSEERIGLVGRLFSFAGGILPDPVGALCEKELLTFSRIPRFRLVYAMSCFFGFVFVLPQMHRSRHDGFLFQNALPLMTLYGLLMLGQISYWNAFGFDRSAVQGYFSWPIQFRSALVAKNIATASLLIPQILCNALFAYTFHLPISTGRVAETVAVIAIAALYWFALGNICSVRIPRAMNPDKMNQLANKLQALSIWSAPFLLLPLGLAYWARAVFHNEWIFAGLVLVAGIIGVVFYSVALDSAVNTAHARREKIILELTQADGPLSLT